MERQTVTLLLFAAFSAAGGQLLFKIGAKGREQWIEFFNLHVGFGLILYGISTLLWIYTLSQEKLVNVYAFTALTFVLVYVGGVFLIGEKISIITFFGIVLILAGLYLITNFNT